MLQLGPWWTLLLLAGTVTLVVGLITLLFPASGVPRRNSPSNAGTVGLLGEPYPTDEWDKVEGDVLGRERNSST